MTMNDSWGFTEADDAWKNSKTIVRNLIECANGGGNYLLNIGPKPDGSVPEQSVNSPHRSRQVDEQERADDL